MGLSGTTLALQSCSRLRVTAFREHFFALGEVALPALPTLRKAATLDGILVAHGPSGTAHALRHSSSASLPAGMQVRGVSRTRKLRLRRNRTRSNACTRLTAFRQRFIHGLDGTPHGLLSLRENRPCSVA